MYWTDICASVHIHNIHLEVRPNKMQYQIWHANQLSKFNILHSTDFYSITTLNALKALIKAPLNLTFLVKLYRNVHLQTHCSLWPSDSKNESKGPVWLPWSSCPTSVSGLYRTHSLCLHAACVGCFFFVYIGAYSCEKWETFRCRLRVWSTCKPQSSAWLQLLS